MNKFRLLLFVTAVFAFMLASCEKDPIEDRIQQDDMIVNNNLSDLNKRVSKAPDDHVISIYPVEDNFRIKSTKRTKSTAVSSNYILKLRAEVSPPVSENGTALQASHIKIAGDYAFVTYNVKGDKYLGGLDIFDISDISNPELINNAIFPSRDISSVDVEKLGSAGRNHFVYLTGAQEMGPSDKLGLNSSAVIEKYNLNDRNEFMHIEDGRQHYDLPGFAGNDVRYKDGTVYATSGSSGGLSILGTGLNLLGFEAIDFARSVDIDGSRVAVFSADGGNLHIMDVSVTGNPEDVQISEVAVINTGGASYPEAKSIVRIKDDFVFVALGDGGMKMYDINSGTLIGYLERPEILDDANPHNYVSNGVSVNDDLVFIANGGSGVHVAQLAGENEIVTVGRMMFEQGSSANFIESFDNKVFVATGLGGLKIIEIVHYDPGSGDLPVDDVDPEPTIPCETLYDKIKSLFPERASIHEGPQADLIGEVPGTLRLKEKAPVFISFVHNGAGWDNSFGYYTYDADNPPASAEELQLNIIFPDAKNHGDDKLAPGDRVRLGGPTVEFNANTVIGFFLVAKGWDPGQEKMVKGIHNIYSDKQFNPEGAQKHVLFLEETCNDIVISFEDQLGTVGSGSDEDFNDMIFVVSNGDDEFGTQVNDAFDIEGLPRR